jgi:hypothetical protein
MTRFTIGFLHGDDINNKWARRTAEKILYDKKKREEKLKEENE